VVVTSGTEYVPDIKAAPESFVVWRVNSGKWVTESAWVEVERLAALLYLRLGG
jgi:hypothetical protein